MKFFFPVVPKIFSHTNNFGPGPPLPINFILTDFMKYIVSQILMQNMDPSCHDVWFGEENHIGSRKDATETIL
jgi:hypothetical protein